MRKHSRQEEVKSKYFSIDSYFKAPAVKKIKALAFDQEVEKATELSLKPTLELESKKEQCPICQAFICIESVSMEVHVNSCLDSLQQTKENEPPPPAEQSSSSTSVSATWKEKFAFTVIDKSDPVKEIKPTVVKEVLFEHKQDVIVERQTKEKDVIVERKEEDVIVEEHKKENVVEEETRLMRRILPTSWKNMFFSSSSSSTTTTTTAIAPHEMKNVNTSLKSPKKKFCPFYKRVRDTRFVVDAFNYGCISDCDGYFLTHYHSDHFGGLKSSWSHGPIYCSQVTANLVKQELHVDRRYIHPLPMNQLYPIPGSNVTIALIDANHCPGSVLFLFIVQLANGSKVRHLHTGDFRATPRMCLHPLIRQPENPPINVLYLDTTYLNPQYAFPAQEECIKAVCQVVKSELDTLQNKKPSLLESWVTKKVVEEEAPPDPMTDNNAFKLMMNPRKKLDSSTPRVMIVVGTYTIGKERVFFNIAKMLNCKIYAPPKKKRILLCQEDEQLTSMLTSNSMEAQVHAVSLRDIRSDIMSKYLDDHKTHFDSLIAFKPTGWTYKSSNSQTSDMKLAPLSHIIIPPSDRTVPLQPYYKNNKLKLYGVPYSEHSSFRELASFIASLDIKQIIPTVNINQHQNMSTYFDKWEQEKASKRIEVVSYPNEDHW